MYSTGSHSEVNQLEPQFSVKHDMDTDGFSLPEQRFSATIFHSLFSKDVHTAVLVWLPKPHISEHWIITKQNGLHDSRLIVVFSIVKIKSKSRFDVYMTNAKTKPSYEQTLFVDLFPTNKPIKYFNRKMSHLWPRTCKPESATVFVAQTSSARFRFCWFITRVLSINAQWTVHFSSLRASTTCLRTLK